MRLIRTLAVLLPALLLSHMSLVAQVSAFPATNQAMALLPDEVNNLSIVDGDLYCYASGVLLKSQRAGQQNANNRCSFHFAPRCISS